MIIREIRLNNFMSYYGKHVIRLRKGLNFILGSCGSGRTNLARAFSFAILGFTDVSKSILINLMHVSETLHEDGNPFCEVEVDFLDGTQIYTCKGRLELAQDGSTYVQSGHTPVRVAEIFTLENSKLTYLNALSMEIPEDEDASFKTRIEHALLSHLKKNIEAGVRIAFLDRVFDHFTPAEEEILLNYLAKSGMEQLVFLETKNLPPEYERYITNRVEFLLSQTSRIVPVTPITEETSGDVDLPNSPVDLPLPPQPAYELIAWNLELVIFRLRQRVDDLSLRWNQLTEKFLEARNRRDMARANVHACEIAEVRVMIKTVIRARLALEHVAKRLDQATRFEEIPGELPLFAELVHLTCKMIPFSFSEDEWGRIRITLIEIEERIRRSCPAQISADFSKESAQKVLESVLSRADKEVKEKFKLPTDPL